MRPPDVVSLHIVVVPHRWLHHGGCDGLLRMGSGGWHGPPCSAGHHGRSWTARRFMGVFPRINFPTFWPWGPRTSTAISCKLTSLHQPLPQRHAGSPVQTWLRVPRRPLQTRQYRIQTMGTTSQVLQILAQPACEQHMSSPLPWRPVQSSHEHLNNRVASCASTVPQI